MIRKPAAGVESCEENTNIVRSGNRGDKTSSDSLVLCRCSQQSTGGREHAAKSDNYCVRGEKNSGCISISDFIAGSGDEILSTAWREIKLKRDEGFH